MYYYILEAGRGRESFLAQNIERSLDNLGIMGEFSFVSKTRSAGELAKLAIMKNYSTIVAVGGDSLANKVASVILNEKVAKEIAFGIIPQGGTKELEDLVGTASLKQAIENLAFRKIQVVDVAKIVPGRFFLTSAEIKPPSPTIIWVRIDEMKLQAQMTHLQITPKLQLVINNQTQSPPPAQKFYSWLLSKELIDRSTSILRGNQISIETPQPLALTVAGEAFAHTPFTIQGLPRTLQLITTRARLKQQERETS